MDIIPQETIIQKIYEFRGVKVMLDSDLAALYEVETKALNQAVKRNPERFPEDFMFRLDDRETDSLRSQNVTANLSKRRNNPYAFTENGVSMLSSVLRSQKAIDINIQIMRTFTDMRRYALSHRELMERIEKLEKTDQQIIDVLNQLLRSDKEASKTDGKLGFEK